MGLFSHCGLELLVPKCNLLMRKHICLHLYHFCQWYRCTCWPRTSDFLLNNILLFSCASWMWNQQFLPNRALKTRGNTPKYGLIFHSTFIGRAAAKNKGRISRYLANKCTIASRIDCFSGERLDRVNCLKFMGHNCNDAHIFRQQYSSLGLMLII